MGKRAAIAGVVCWVLAASCAKDDTAPAAKPGAGGATGGSSGNAGSGGKGGGGTSGGKGGSAGTEGGTAGTTLGNAGEGGGDASGGTSGNGGNGGGGKGGSSGKGGSAGNGATSGSGGSDTGAGEGGGGSSAGTAGAGGIEGTVELTPEDGGTITVGGTTVSVPAGAVDEPVTITVRTVDLQDLPLLPGGIRSVGPTVELLPHGTSFSQPISITLAHSAPSGETVSVMRLDDGADITWESVPGVTSDATTATFQTQTFCDLTPTAEFDSCDDLESICGKTSDGSSAYLDCCQSLLVTGQTYTQGPGPADQNAFESTVAPFELDRFEVVVGRMRHFVEHYDEWRGAGYPPVGAGANDNVPDSGWQASFNNSLPADAAALVASLKCDATMQTWRDVPDDETLPITCANWYVSFAFCIWDNGRLPTESEWEAAASGGINELVYPWGNTVPTDVQDGVVEFGVYSCMADGSAPGDCTGTDILPVGSKPNGMGLFGHHDLSGNMTEWALDYYGAYPATPQTNYANLTPAFTRTYRGGAFNFGVQQMRATYRASAAPDLESPYVGLRCARNVAP